MKNVPVDILFLWIKEESGSGVRCEGYEREGAEGVLRATYWSPIFKAASGSFVHTEAVRPKSLSFMSWMASSSDDTYKTDGVGANHYDSGTSGR